MSLLTRTALLALLLAGFVISPASRVLAQNCNYQLILEDLVRADGWNGGEVTVTVAGTSRSYTLTEDDDSTRSVFFPVMTGDAITIGFRRGAFPEETSFRLLNNNDSLIYAVTSPATTDELVTLTADCVSCAPPAANGVFFSRVRFNFAVLSWRPVGAADRSYEVIYGEAGFRPDGPGEIGRRSVQDTFLRVNDLLSDSTYDFFLRTLCPLEPDSSMLRGPFSVLIPKEKDVGATQLITPVSDCELGSETITIGITNFGGAAQQFFNVNFSVNGGGGIASQPADGVFTGVVGVDSTEEFTFDVPINLSGAGTYTVRVWTELEDDQDPSNDTLTTAVTNILRVTDFPYRENFESNNGFWRPARGGDAPSSWEYGRVSGTIFDNAGSGSRAWATNLDGDYNNNELSYLQSPCFDFSDFDEDPIFSALLYLDTEPDFDALWLESSVDGGLSWQRVESSPAAVNWYNDLENQLWEGTGGFGNGYAAVANELGGLAGVGEARLRFVFRSSRSDTRPGVAIDDIAIQARATIDLAVNRVRFGADQTCADLPADSLFITISNFGIETIDSVAFEVSYLDAVEVFRFGQLGLTTRETMTLGVALSGMDAGPFSGSAQLTVIGAVIGTFETGSFDNNLAVLEGFGYRDLPFFTDFGTGAAPDLWTLDDDLLVLPRGNAGSLALTDNLNAVDTSARFTTANYGLTAPGDSLRFDIALTDFAPDTTLTTVAGDLIVNAIYDCRDTVNLLTEIGSIDAETLVFALDGSGRTVTFEIIARRDTGDFLIAFDNVNVGMECPDDLGVVVDVLPATRPNRANGTVTLIPTRGLAPFTYDWSNGATTSSVDSIAPGEYTVEVMDARGCTELVRVTVDFNTSLDETGVLAALTVFPNPTRSDLQLRLDLSEELPVTATLHAVTGRELRRQDYGLLRSLSTVFPTDGLPSGLYFLTVRAGGAQRTIRVVVW